MEYFGFSHKINLKQFIKRDEDEEKIIKKLYKIPKKKIVPKKISKYDPKKMKFVNVEDMKYDSLLETYLSDEK